MNILECKNLTKSYKKGTPVLHGLNLQIPAGKIVGLLGPNGCGKSTLIKLISGLLQPDSGEISVNGLPVGEKSKALISYLPERTYFNSWMKVSQLIEYFEEFYADFDAPRAYKLMNDLGIKPTAKLKSLSKGTKEKIQLILVMSRNAKLYLLDEPIAGVDPAAREYILSTIVGNYNPEASIIITTHLITDVEQVLDDFVFLSYGGNILMSGNAEEVRNQSGKSLDELFREVFKC
ncbi:MAG: ABC transporter ATP-binding protein [Clostridia bacterium]|nr:ABC transporter ATP-binding protein [Clostridia bacterium]